MTKKQILELTGLSESEFYKKYPTKESFEKDMETYKKGGIYIKPENRGKFTATKKRTGKTTEELTHSKNPLTRKRAIFAQNAKKWKHAEGGEVKPDNPGFNALPKNVQDKIIANMVYGGKINKYAMGGQDIIINNSYPALQQPQQQTQKLNQNNQAITNAISQLGNIKTNQSQIGQLPQQSNTGKSVGSLIGGIAGSLIPIPGVGTALGSTVGGMIGGAIDKKSYENKVADYDMNNLTKAQGGFKKGGELIKRADGSYSRRGLWDNIRANKGSGKAPTKEMLKQEKKIKAKMAKGGKLEHLGDNLYKVKSHIKGTDKVEVRPNVFFDDKEVVRKNSDGSMQILSDDLGYAKPVEKVAKAMGGKAAQSLFNAMYTKQEMSKAKRPVDKFADNANKRMSYNTGGLKSAVNMANKIAENINLPIKKPSIPMENSDFPIYPTPDFELPKEEPIYPTPDLKKPVINENLKDNPAYFNPLTDVNDNTPDDFYIPELPESKNPAYNVNRFSLTPGVGIKPDYKFKTSGSLGYDTPTTQPGTFNVKAPVTNLEASKFIGETKGKYGYNPSPINPNLYKMDQISPWWLAASEAGNIANLLMSKPSDVNLPRYKPTLVDPYRSNRLLASELRKQANATSSAIRGTANTQGTYLASELANRSRLNETIGSQLAQSNLQSLLSNTDIINKARLANVEIGTTEQDLRQREKDAARTIRSQAISQMGANAMQYGRDRKQVDMTNKMLPFISPEGYQIVTNPDGTIGFKRKSGSGVNNLNFSYT